MPLDRLALLAGRSWRASDLPGGLTNHNVRVVTDDDGPPLDIVVRCSSSDAGLLMQERRLTILLEQLKRLSIATVIEFVHATNDKQFRLGKFRPELL